MTKLLLPVIVIAAVAISAGIQKIRQGNAFTVQRNLVSWIIQGAAGAVGAWFWSYPATQYIALFAGICALSFVIDNNKKS